MRLARILLTFVISGILHASVDLAGGMSWHESGSLRFFFTQALGLIVEWCVEEALGGFVVQKAEGSPKSPLTPWVRMLDYVWASAFMVWSTPVYSYPTIRRAEDGGRY